MILPKNYLVLDVETANRNRASICQIGITYVANSEVKNLLTFGVNPLSNFDNSNMSLHGITPAAVVNCKSFPELYSKLQLVLERIPVFQHGPFDQQAVDQACATNRLPVLNVDWQNSIEWLQYFWASLGINSYKLDSLCQMYDILIDHHDAGSDSLATAKLLNLAAHKTSLKVPSHLIPNDYQDIQNGMTVVFSGNMNKKELEKLAVANGYQVGRSVTGKTDLLCLGATDQRTLDSGNLKSVKHRRAEELKSKGSNIKILSEEEFRNLVQH